MIVAFDLDNLFEQHFFSNLDYFFSRSMAKAFNEKDIIVLASCALVSKYLFAGHICLDIKRLSGMTRSVSRSNDDMVKFPDLDVWLKALENSLMISDDIQTPLVLDSDQRLYFSKYYDFQNRLTKNIARRVLLKPLKMDDAIIDEMLESYFTKSDRHHINHQKNGVKNALFNHFTIISGGPGTGKTFVTNIIKKMFVAYAYEHGLPEPKIICVAPTGKAASKMEQGSTIHSILKPLRDDPGFYYNKNNRLQTDVIIIDEASMIDVLLLTRLLEAVPMEAQVIILGDKNQLSSIQAGSVFSDICSVKELSSNIFLFEYNFRSKGKTGIENLSKAITGNDAQRLEEVLTCGRYPDIIFETFNDKDPAASVINKYILERYKPFITADKVETALNELDEFKILCAHNSGVYGTLQVNHVCENILRSGTYFDIQEKFFKKIIMVNTNDYKKRLFNGDTGIVFENKEVITAFFKSLDNNIKQYRGSDLPGYDPTNAPTSNKRILEWTTYIPILVHLPFSAYITMPDSVSSFITLPTVLDKKAS